MKASQNRNRYATNSERNISNRGQLRPNKPRTKIKVRISRVLKLPPSPLCVWHFQCIVDSNFIILIIGYFRYVNHRLSIEMLSSGLK